MASKPHKEFMTLKVAFDKFKNDGIDYAAFENIIHSSNKIIEITYFFIRFYLLHCFENNLICPNIDKKFLKAISDIINNPDRDLSVKKQGKPLKAECIKIIKHIRPYFTLFCESTGITKCPADKNIGIIRMAHKQMITNILNNIEFHYEQHVKKYVRAKFVDEHASIREKKDWKSLKKYNKKINRIVYNVVHKKIAKAEHLSVDTIEICKELDIKVDILEPSMKRFNEILEIDEILVLKPTEALNSTNIENNMFTYLKRMITINKYIEDKGMKNCQFFPIKTSCYDNYVKLDTTALVDIFHTQFNDEIKKTYGPSQNYSKYLGNPTFQKKVWECIFNFKHKNKDAFKKKYYQFDAEITTDGYAVSLTFIRKDLHQEKLKVNELMKNGRNTGHELNKLKKNNPTKFEEETKKLTEQKKLKMFIAQNKKKESTKLKKVEKEKEKAIFDKLSKEEKENVELQQKIRDAFASDFPYVETMMLDEVKRKKLIQKYENNQIVFCDPGKRSLLYMMCNSKCDNNVKNEVKERKRKKKVKRMKNLNNNPQNLSKQRAKRYIKTHPNVRNSITPVKNEQNVKVESKTITTDTFSVKKRQNVKVKSKTITIDTVPDKKEQKVNVPSELTTINKLPVKNVQNAKIANETVIANELSAKNVQNTNIASESIINNKISLTKVQKVKLAREMLKSKNLSVKDEQNANITSETVIANILPVKKEEYGRLLPWLVPSKNLSVKDEQNANIASKTIASNVLHVKKKERNDIQNYGVSYWKHEKKNGRIKDYGKKFMNYTNATRLKFTNRLKNGKKIEEWKKIVKGTDNKCFKDFEKELPKFSKSCHSDKFLEYVKGKMTFNSEVQARGYDLKYLQKLKWYSYLDKRKHDNRLIKHIKNTFGPKPTIIIGDWSAKGKLKFISTPNLHLKRKLKEHFEVLHIDEYKTSQMHYKHEQKCKHMYVKPFIKKKGVKKKTSNDSVEIKEPTKPIESTEKKIPIESIKSTKSQEFKKMMRKRQDRSDLLMLKLKVSMKLFNIGKNNEDIKSISVEELYKLWIKKQVAIRKEERLERTNKRKEIKIKKRNAIPKTFLNRMHAVLTYKVVEEMACGNEISGCINRDRNSVLNMEKIFCQLIKDRTRPLALTRQNIQSMTLGCRLKGKSLGKYTTR